MTGWSCWHQLPPGRGLAVDGGCVSAYTGAHSHTSFCGRGLRLSRTAGLGIDHSSPLSGNMILWPSKAFPKCWHPACLRTGWSSLPATGARAPGTSVCPVAPAARPPGQCMGTSHGIRWLRVGALQRVISSWLLGKLFRWWRGSHRPSGTWVVAPAVRV